MRVCDRCRKDMDNESTNTIGSYDIELCNSCTEHILNNIQHYKPKGFFARIFGKR